ncbi:hypothetical protein EJ03DRAFT_13583 [Teratosphaeria nubilosa]|uniref:Uncharacterized protein n=1 Tax=Teratosphaeria nubilosa TaxID=161662 RepID=A0A6G1KWZ1_9PEZI|nr:hypothetical protein EJ03DRAFT_13583 [Teratosphaeria nubilosa]
MVELRAHGSRSIPAHLLAALFSRDRQFCFYMWVACCSCGCQRTLSISLIAKQHLDGASLKSLPSGWPCWDTKRHASVHGE